MRLPPADFSTAARLMEQTVEQFWVRGEAATMARWVLALPDPLVREHTRLVLTTALYLLHPVTYSTREQRESRHQQVRQLMARVEAALQHQANETNQEIWLRAQARPFAPSIWRPAMPRRLCCIGVCACYARGWPCMRR